MRYDPVIRLTSRPLPARRRSDRRALPAGLDRPGEANARPTATTPARRFAVGSAGCANRGRSICFGKKKAEAVECTRRPAGRVALGRRRRRRESNSTKPRISGHPVLLSQAEEIQDAVRRRVSERTWQLFWNIAILGQAVRETAAAAGISYYAAFAAERRVAGRMLREEGQRFLAEPRVLEPEG